MTLEAKHSLLLRRLREPTTEVVTTQGAGAAAAARSLIGRRNIRPGRLVCLHIEDLTEPLLKGGLERLTVALQFGGFALADAVYREGGVRLFFRAGEAVEPDELPAWIVRGGAEFALTYPDPNDLLRRVAVLGHRFYEQDMLEHVAAKVRDGFVVDVGAHVGNHAIYLARFAGARVHAYEPAPDAFRCLAKNIAANGLGTKIAAHRLAIGAAAGAGGMIATQRHNTGATRFLEEAGDIPLATLDVALAGLPRVDAIKIDVEGMEGDVVVGGLGMIRRDRPLLYIELLTDHAAVEIETLVAPLGYRRGASFGGRDNRTIEFIAK